MSKEEYKQTFDEWLTPKELAVRLKMSPSNGLLFSPERQRHSVREGNKGEASLLLGERQRLVTQIGITKTEKEFSGVTEETIPSEEEQMIDAVILSAYSRELERANEKTHQA